MIALTRSGFVGIAWILRGETMGASHIDTGILLAVIPLVIIDLAMVVYCIVDLFKPDRKVRGNNKLVWLLVILLVSTLGWLIYLLAGREE
ncbi:MAG TPA: PLDc N-terminal domain-containing protein [Ktedonobacterales bacterium]|nr:PLDc N-terminal domain-containing protein [Ktedonobacterales bacterium]